MTCLSETAFGPVSEVRERLLYGLCAPLGRYRVLPVGLMVQDTLQFLGSHPTPDNRQTTERQTEEE